MKRGKGNKKDFIQLLRRGALYAITADIGPCGVAVKQVEALLAAGIEILQYRRKNLSLEEKQSEIKRIQALPGAECLWLIVNDDPALAKEVKADGVHLGQEDMDPIEARRLLGFEAVIGLSTHEQGEALAASKEPVDYLGVGPIFPTQTKALLPIAGLDYAGWAAKHVDLPLVAIGGIGEDNCAKLVERGIRSVAMIQELLLEDGLAARVRRIQDCLRKV